MLSSDAAQSCSSALLNNATLSNSTPLSTSGNNTSARGKQRGHKLNWFHSLTRCRKTQPPCVLHNAAAAVAEATAMSTNSAAGVADLRLPLPLQQDSSNNNNNNNNNDGEVMHTDAAPAECAAETTPCGNGALCGTLQLEHGHFSNSNSSSSEGASGSGSSSKQKDDKNVLQLIKRKMGIRLHALRRQKNYEASEGGATADASSEFVRQASPAREPALPLQRYHYMSSEQEDADMVPFTRNYKRFVAKKWLTRESEPNYVMYKASAEMLKQVWYWGEISRRDAQRQLTDKPTGSFLVRDSETSGPQFTLSFRIVNVTLHYRLEYRDSFWHFEELQYESIVAMIEDILFRCTNDNFVCFVRVPNEMQPPFPVILKYPLSRYLNMPQLQDLCRRVIQRHVAESEIAELPIPPKLQEYLSEKRELVF